MSFNSLRDGLKQVKKKYDDFNRQHNIFPTSQTYQQGPPQHQQYFSSQPQSQPYPNPQSQHLYTNQPQYPYQQQQQQPPQYQSNIHDPQQPYSAAPPPPPPEWNRPPPPIPQHSHPSQQLPSRIYWQAKFDPSIPVSQEWEQKLGNNNGWGNNELEHYTAHPENAFFTSDNKLIIRAIANNSSPHPHGRYTSARLVSRTTLSRPKGVLTAFLTCPSAGGIWPAFWLLPREPFQWPTDGEIDIAESWNAENRNHSCLHWGAYVAEDASKHRTMGTQIPDLHRRAVRYDLAWDQSSGRLMWFIDGRPVMKASVPQGTRPLHDWCIIINIAMGGNVCAGQTPRDGAYDFVIHSVYMSEEPENGGWQGFDREWHRCPDGNPM